jgi:transposase
MKMYIVELTTEERSLLDAIIADNRKAAHKRLHAQMLLAIDQGSHGPGIKDADAAKAFGCTTKTIERLRRRFLKKGLECGLEHGNRGCYRAKALDGVGEAHLIALACGDPPEGHNRWTVRLLADRIVSLDLVESCGKSSVYRVLKKTNLSLT